jgi:tripartite-type tricarboxylate transporter receptor subunit TctC
VILPRTVPACLVFVASFVATATSSAQAFPEKPIRLITELAAGSGGDVYLRRLLPHISSVLGQPVVLDNRAGAGGVVAAEFVARAAPDGYTVLAATQNALIMRRFLAKTNSVDVFRDLVAVSEIWKATTLILAGPSVRAKSLAELIEYARANPGKVSYGTSGFGTSHHFTGEEIQQLTGSKMTHVPYKGGVGSMQAVMTGEVDVAIGFGATALPVVRSGKVRVLAVVEGRRFGGIPDVPLAAEVIPGFEPPPSWLGVFAPAALAPRLVSRLSGDIAKALRAPGLHAGAGEEGLELSGGSPREFSLQLRKQHDLIGRIARAAKILPTEH